MKIVCLGDSLTAGMNRDAPGHWVNILNRNAVHTYINKGICGDTTGGMLARFYRDVVEEKAQSVIIMGGGNDFIMGNGLASVQANIMAMVHQSFFYNIMPVIGIPVTFDKNSVRGDWASFTDFSEVIEKYEIYRKWVYKFSKTFHAQVLDFEAFFESNIRDARKDFFEDGIHPNDRGNRIMADLILQSGM